jgi:hypothetical protein
MTRRFVLLTLIANALLYVALLLLFRETLLKTGISFSMVPTAPIVIGVNIFRASNFGEFILCTVTLLVASNACVSTVISVLKYDSMKLCLFAHFSLILYWGLSLLILVIFK